MRKILFLTFLSISLSFAGMNKAHAVDPKGKAFAIICAYGTVGGALLGFASMAFGANSRAIAQGASLGLYAGIGFGAYVISSYADPNSPMNDPYAPQSSRLQVLTLMHLLQVDFHNQVTLLMIEVGLALLRKIKVVFLVKELINLMISNIKQKKAS